MEQPRDTNSDKEVEQFGNSEPPPYFGEALIATLIGIVPAALWIMVTAIHEMGGQIDRQDQGWLLLLVPLMLGLIGMTLGGFLIIFLPWLALAKKPVGWIAGLIWFAVAAFGLRSLLLNLELFPAEDDDYQILIDELTKKLAIWFAILSIAVPLYVQRRRNAGKPPL